MSKLTIVIDGKELECTAGQTLLQALLTASIPIETACGGKGGCQLCRVTVVSGGDSLPKPSPLERNALGNVLIAQGMRLSCQITLQDPLEIRMPVYRHRKRPRSG